MEIVTSVQNRTVKLFRSLSEKKFREREGLFPVEGGNISKDIPPSAKVRFVLAVPERLGEAEARFPEAQVKSVSGTVTPYGLAAAVELPRYTFAPTSGNALLLDGVSDPGNLGTIIRTAAATGFNDVYLLDCADAYAPKAVRASMGGIFRVRACEVTEEEAVRLASDTRSAALDMGGKDIFSFPVLSPCLLVAGSEAHGVRQSVLRAVKEVRALPMTGGMESLNVAVAAGIAMYTTFSLSIK